MKRILLAASVAFCGCSSFNESEWNPRDTALEVGFQVLNAYDAHTTQRIGKSATIEESAVLTRAVLGPKPGANETAVYFAVSGLSHYLIGRSLPPKWRKWWQAGTIVYTGSLIDQNCDLGLC